MIRIRPFEETDWVATWRVIEPVFRAGETYAVSPDITQDEAHKVWVEAPSATFVAMDRNNDVPRSPRRCSRSARYGLAPAGELHAVRLLPAGARSGSSGLAVWVDPRSDTTFRARSIHCIFLFLGRHDRSHGAPCAGREAVHVNLSGGCPRETHDGYPSPARGPRTGRSPYRPGPRRR